MPEAAEVAVAAAQLAHVAVGRTLSGLAVTHPRTRRHTEPTALDALVGRRIVGVHRHGKWLLVDLEGTEAALGVHLRMSGQLLAQVVDAQPADRHVHARLSLSARAGAGPHVAPAPPPERGAPGTGAEPVEVWFRDPRTFGELRALPGRPPVGADLWDPAVDGAGLAAAAARRRVGVKAVLLDQTGPVAGIGSYLADEALHRAGIAPVASAQALATSAWDRILAGARDVAAEAMAVGGVTLADEGWVDLWGRSGGGADLLAVHARSTCRSCGEPTRSAVVGGRRARWCPRCQHHRRRR